MFIKKLSLFFVLAVIASVVFASPAAAKQGDGVTSFNGSEIFVSYIDSGKTTDGGMGWHNQTIVNIKFSSDPRLTGINIVTSDALFDSTGNGTVTGKFHIQAGSFELGIAGAPLPMVYSIENPCGNAPRTQKQCFRYSPLYKLDNMWLVFYPDGGGWQGKFESTLAKFGLETVGGSATGFGIGNYGGHTVNATIAGFSSGATLYYGTIK